MGSVKFNALFLLPAQGDSLSREDKIADSGSALLIVIALLESAFGGEEGSVFGNGRNP